MAILEEQSGLSREVIMENYDKLSQEIIDENVKYLIKEFEPEVQKEILRDVAKGMADSLVSYVKELSPQRLVYATSVALLITIGTSITVNAEQQHDTSIAVELKAEQDTYNGFAFKDLSPGEQEKLKQEVYKLVAEIELYQKAIIIHIFNKTLPRGIKNKEVLHARLEETSNRLERLVKKYPGVEKMVERAEKQYE